MRLGIESVRMETTQDMALYAKAHIRRVILLSQALLTERPDAFPGVQKGPAQRFAALHDRAKTGRYPDFIERHGLPEPLAAPLLRMWGRGVGAADREVIECLNRTDEQICESFFRRRGIPPNVAEQYRHLVHIADLVDRGMDAVSCHLEMGRELKAASTFLRDPVDRELARTLEGLYPRVVSAQETFAGLRGRLQSKVRG